MKDFLKYTLATIVGIFICAIIMGGFAMIGLVGMIASMNTTTEVKDNSVLVLNLSGVMEERSDDNTLSSLLGETGTTTGLDDMISAVKKAKVNDKIKGIYI